MPGRLRSPVLWNQDLSWSWRDRSRLRAAQGKHQGSWDRERQLEVKLQSGKAMER
jgi:hypothetical protein